MKTLEEFDFTQSPKISPQQVHELAQRVDPRLHPSIPCTGAIAEAIENSRDLSVGKSAGEISDDLDDLALGGTTMLACSTLSYIQYGMFATLPVDSQFDTLIANDIG